MLLFVTMKMLGFPFSQQCEYKWEGEGSHGTNRSRILVDWDQQMA